MRSVGVIGSSGGGTATLGHTDPIQFLQILNDELEKIDDGIAMAIFVSLDGGKSMDTANPKLDRATLYAVEPVLLTTTATTSTTASRTYQDTQLLGSFNVRIILRGTLMEVNQKCQEMDLEMAKQIESGLLKSLICISCHAGIHEASLRAAAQLHIPVTGSGGSSLSTACASYGINLVGNAGGSVATTAHTRAVSYTHALSKASLSQNQDYRPWKTRGSTTINRPSWRSVLNSCLPAFWAVCLLRRYLQYWIKHDGNDSSKSSIHHFSSLLSSGDDKLLKLTWFRALDLALENFALPVACAIVMANAYAPHHGSTVILAATVASMVCRQTILGGLVAGWLVAVLSDRFMYFCIAWNVPATMTSLLVAGGTGGVVATALVPFVPTLRYCTTMVRWIVFKSMNGSIPGVGFMMGCLFCYWSKVGYYHALCLPIILMEMETGQPSVWGAIDELTLVLVSAGINAANLITLSARSHGKTLSLCRRGLLINLLCGDFVEACYPFMEQYTLINIGGYFGSGLATQILARGRNPKSIASLAYLPLPMSIWLATNWQRLAFAAMIAMGIPFQFTMFNNLVFRRYK
jgi:hypothetical protein